MENRNKVYIATSIDGYIADRNEGLEWLEMVPNPDNDSMGFPEFMDSIDALLMGKNTYQKVLSFGIEWPYNKPVYVLSTTLNEIPEELKDKVFLINGSIKEVLKMMNDKGLHKLYLDGGRLIQSFLKEDLVDDLIISQIPVLLGGGFSLFGELPKHLEFELKSSQVLLKQIVQNHYTRKR